MNPLTPNEIITVSCALFLCVALLLYKFPDA